jgi:hypothetical protein
MATFNFVYTPLTQKKAEDGRKWSVFALTNFTASTSGTYVSGGIALNLGQLGLPYGQLDTVDILDQNADGYVYSWNRSTGKIQMFVESGTSNHILNELTSSISPTVALTIEVKGY